MKDKTLVFESIEASEVKVRVYGDAAVVTSRCHVKLTDRGHQLDHHVRSTQVYAKREGKWLCVSSQVTGIVETPKEKR